MLKLLCKLMIFVLIFSILYSDENKLKEQGLLNLEMNSYVKDREKMRRYFKFVNEDTLFYRELSYYERFNPDFIAISLSKREIEEIKSSTNKLEKYDEIINRHDKNFDIDKTEIMDYYIEDEDRERIITRSGRFIEYIFSGYFSDFYIKREVKINKEDFDRNFNKVLDGRNFIFYNISYRSSEVVSREKKEVVVTSETIEELKNGLIMYCDIYKVCEKIDLNSNKIKITKKSDYIEVKINNREGFYIVDNYYEPISESQPYSESKLIPHDKLNISDFNYFLKLLKF